MTTLREIARRAGVSPATVSRVLNGQAHVGAETAQRVMAVLATVDYRQGLAAARLHQEGSDQIGILHYAAPDLADGQLVEIMETTFFNAGYKTFSCSAEGSAEKESLYLDAMMKRRVAGVVLSPQGHFDRALVAARRLQAEGIRVSLLEPGRMLRGIPMVGTDPSQAWELALQYMARRGHRHILCLLSGQEARLDAAKADMSITLCDMGLGSDAASMEEAFSASNFDAVICGRERIALQVLRHLHCIEGNPPEVLTLQGSSMSRMARPRLVAIGLPVDDLGRLCAEQLLAQIRWPDRAVSKILLEGRLLNAGADAA